MKTPLAFYFFKLALLGMGAASLSILLSLDRAGAFPLKDRSSSEQPLKITTSDIAWESMDADTKQWPPNDLASATWDPEIVFPDSLSPPKQQLELAQNPSTETEETAAKETPQLKLVAPRNGQVVDIPSTSIILQHPVDAEIKLMVNGEPVDDSLIGRVATDNRNNRVLKTWYGVSLSTGENVVSAQGTLNGEPLPPTQVVVSVRAKPAALTLETVAEIPADGRTTTTVKGTLLDENGNRSNHNAMVTLNASAGTFVGADAQPSAPGFQAEAREGRFSAELQAGVEAQTVRIQAQTIELEAFTTLRFAPPLREKPLATGYLNFRLGGSGSNFFDFMEDFVPLDEENQTELEITGAAFATGAIGEWQYTGALNTDAPLNQDCCGEAPLMRAFDETNDVYGDYGDDSSVDVVTPSTDSFFFRIERASPVENADLDFAMWGDYNLTGFSEQSQQFSSFSRTLHGFNGRYNWGDLQFNAFYANNVEGFQRDIIAPDGTRGFYFLSRRDVVEGSEEIYIELEELERPGTAIQRERLSRGRDYDIDYDRGAILFDRPISRTLVDDQGRVLVRKVVVTYEFEGEGEEANLLGGRLKYYLSRDPNHESWIGTTYIAENKGEQDFTLFGADALLAWGDNNTLILEYAHSSHENTEFGDISGSAYRIEAVTELWEGVKSRAYLESADTGFNNNATGSFVPGQTRYGGEINGKISSTTNLRLRYERQENEGTAPRPLLEFGDLLAPRTDPVPGSKVDNTLTTISAGVQQRIGSANLTVDWIHRDREDNIAPEDLSSSSDQLRTFLDVPLTEEISLQALNTTTLSSETDAVFTDRTSLGVSWEVYPGIELQASQVWYTSGQLAGESITSVGVQGKHEFSSNTTLHGSYAMSGREGGMSAVGSFGIDQGIIISPGLEVDLAFEHVFSNENRFRSSSGVQFAQPTAVGQSSSSLGSSGGTNYSVGIQYTDSPDFNASLRWEHFTSDDRNNTVISANASGNLSPALTALLNYRRASSANQRLDLSATQTLKVGLAYRPPDNDQWNMLLRYEYRKDPDLIPETLLLEQGDGSQEHLFSLEAIYAPSWRWEFYGKFAWRNSTTYLAEDFTASSHLTLTQFRATYRFGEAFDLSGEMRWINQPSAGFSEVGIVTELGYMLNPNLRLAGGYVFGEVDDRDFRGVRSAQGAYLGMTVKLQGLMDLF